MIIILETIGGKKIRINSDKICKYSTDTAYCTTEHGDTIVSATELIIDNCNILFVKESPEEIDDILRVNCVTVYERK
jgi:hypothetical protein